MMWVQCDSSGVVTRRGETKRSARPGAVDYEVDALPTYEPGDVLRYDGETFTIDSTARIAAAKAAIEPDMLSAYARWQSAVTLGLSCEAHCRAMYENLRSEYDAL